MINKITLSILTTAITASTFAHAIQPEFSAHHCKAAETNAQHYRNFPSALIEAQARHEKIANIQSARKYSAQAKQGHVDSLDSTDTSFVMGISATPSYVVPVVFHVYGTVHNGDTVNDAVIIDALYKTNEDFQGQTADYSDIDSEFQNVKDHLNIEFRLAGIDPNGNPTTGIVYHSESSGAGNYSSSDVKNDHWDNYKYMNVYIQNDLYADGVTNNSGVAWYPDSGMSDDGLARVAYNGAYLGTNTDENFRSVLTHEFGHFMDLIHTFEGRCKRGAAKRCSQTGDEVCDTPQQNSWQMNPGDGGILNCLGQTINWQNFMAYSDQYANFTQDQVDRMINGLNSSARASLWSASNLSATGVAN
ncbi:zinc metalloprotease [Shewanella eurypsychrophilus]|uniref:Zinc metalloprotease n=1 Tax=Shewanella eurypsychrophilus TaxID=2593656 RepID=A0ABX6V2W1_9GAMM|nr:MULTISPECIES: M43 family zinc metalloprotease [Shewanella]QFU21674.1 zinc metalloprotease [Shewanella sp. YLB-09]QPG56964.1 zinc metalloprotease [Shewanella eurypsychrophilus]